jgi:alpha,alpha-trehalose phosphorylase (configuration-retaining)
MDKPDFPNRNYIVQIARFDPSKGFLDALASYAELHHKDMEHFRRRTRLNLSLPATVP